MVMESINVGESIICDEECAFYILDAIPDEVVDRVTRESVETPANGRFECANASEV
eukprot:CAMPEP_0197865078 /NCGR_PEP_ID=MMETSP1438-20131217/43456_1 /TAXON_ID=1461541 /ORGANISM="Pterosperma sp., Strain CCMP1384" /LENGTH=55 /DNA_ID=CAMNT_0043483487 /DNA_START=1023 /DNA_END=1190 /DNA_ORIENTATION=+